MTYRKTLEELVSASVRGPNVLAGLQIRKSGYRGGVTEIMINRLRITRYQASKQQLTFFEFLKHVESASSLEMSDLGSR